MKRAWPETVHTCYDSLQKFRGLNPFIQHPIHKSLDVYPFFIIGSGRSGNTLLRRIIGKTSGIHIPPETYVLRSLIKLFRQNKHLRWQQLVNLMLANIEYHSEFKTFRLDNLRELALELYDTPLFRRSLSHIIDRFYRFHAWKTGRDCERWGDKTPLNTLYLERIHSAFPKAQYINIVRDGCDVSYSYVSAGLYDHLEDAAERWRESVIKADQFANQHSASVLSIRYENLVSEPSKVVKRICGFLEVPYSDKLISTGEEQPDEMGDVEMKDHHYNVKKPITTKSIGKGRRNLSTQKKKELNKIIGKQLQEKGYAPIG